MEDTSTRRRPGRPRGSSRYCESDPQLLCEVVDKLLASPWISPRAAIMQVVGSNASADLRRLQVKFRERSRDEWLADARRRQNEIRRREEDQARRNRQNLHETTINLAILAKRIRESQFMRDLETAQANWKKFESLARDRFGEHVRRHDREWRVLLGFTGSSILTEGRQDLP